MPRQQRRSIRLKQFDYHTPGAYFVTICAYQRQHLFDQPALSEIINTVWQILPQRFPTIMLDEFVVMPNHVHGIVWLGNIATHTEQVDTRHAHPVSVSAVVCAFKSLVAVHYLRWIRENAPDRAAKVWQRGFYERVVRNDNELHAIRQYIQNNPQCWAADNDNLDTLIAKMNAV